MRSKFIDFVTWGALAGVLLGAVGSVSCLTQGEPYTPKPIPTGTSCADAQTRLEELGCDWATSKKGHKFKEVCENAASHGVDLKPACVAQAGSCDEAKRCGQ